MIIILNIEFYTIYENSNFIKNKNFHIIFLYFNFYIFSKQLRNNFINFK